MIGFMVKHLKEYFNKNRKADYVYVTGKGREYFQHKNGRKPLKITMDEAKQIIELRNNGYTIREIYETVDWHHNMSSRTINNFLAKYYEGSFDGVIR